MTDEPMMETQPDGDLVLAALADMRLFVAQMRATNTALVWALEQVRVDLAATRAELQALRDALGLPSAALMENLTDPEECVIAALAAEWRDSQPNAPRTIPISLRAGYSHRQTLNILTGLAARGLVRRNNRVSWLPLNRPGA